ncbi:MAG TPA: SDR family NAD(P)-dependent oxidoreductase, partial [Flavitalea sp.]|nr:SDR family NAD(P)-dependent oxidoreductase [Flavitalea sp.]
EDKQHSTTSWEIDRHAANSFAAIPVIKEADIIYFLGGIGDTDFDISDLTTLNDRQDSGVFSLFRLIKSFISQDIIRKTIQLKVITNNVYQLGSESGANPYAASLSGFVKSLAREYPHWKVSFIDIDTKEYYEALNTNSERSLIAAIVNERANPGGHEVAIRDGKCYTRCLVPQSIPAVPELPWRKSGVYLIVGGAGGIGLELASHLAETVQANLVLVGRSELNPKQKERIAEIESKGSHVLYMQADLTNLREMENVIAVTRDQFGTIHGVVHSAIVLQDQSIEKMDEDAFQSALAPKVSGSVILHKVLKDQPLDFIVFFSAAQSFLGNPGQSNYAAACSFKDAFALYLNQENAYPVSTINWGYWGSIGIVANEKYNKLLKRQGVHSISPMEGMETIVRTIGNRIPQLVAIKAEERALKALGVDTNDTQAPSLTSSSSLAETLVPQITLPQAELDRVLQNKDAYAELNNLCNLALLYTFQKLGYFIKAGETYERIPLMQKLGVVSKYSRLFDSLLNILMKEGYIAMVDQSITTTRALDKRELREDINDVEIRKEYLATVFPEIEPHIILLWTCLEQFEDILGGKVSATEVIFPKSSMALVQRIYKNNAVADYFNHWIAEGAYHYIRERLSTLEQGKRLCIVEVGAGTGSTSSCVMESLSEFENQVQYIYTDISRGFVQYGKQVFAGKYPFSSFQVLDIEKEVDQQGFEPGTCDLIIATNVIHATRNIANAVQRLHSLLRPNGWLIMNEATSIQSFTTLTFGLLDGWWMFEDGELRLKGGPLLSASGWETVLSKNGFDPVKAVGLLPEASNEQHIIIAEKSKSGQEALQERISSQEQVTEVPDIRFKAGNLMPGKVIEISTFNSRNKFHSTQNIENDIKDIMAEILQIDRGEIDLELPFTDFGVDSILALSIIDTINKKLSLTLLATDLFNYSTIQSLAEHIASLLNERNVISEGSIADAEPTIEVIQSTNPNVLPTVQQLTNQNSRH